jgi:septum site-determining protein MinD
MPNVALHLGAPSPPVTISHVLHGKASIHDAIYEHNSGTKIVPGSISISSIPDIIKSGERFNKIIQHLRKENDFVIIDSAPGLNEEALLALRASDEILIVTNPELPAVTDALKTAKMAEKMQKKVIGAIVTRIRQEDGELAIRNVKRLLELPILAKVPEDDAVRRALSLRNAVMITAPKSPASQAYMKLASKIARQDYSEERSFLEKLFGWMWR